MKLIKESELARYKKWLESIPSRFNGMERSVTKTLKILEEREKINASKNNA